MEPRLRSRGSRTSTPSAARNVCLQWSRGCEAAEARRIRDGSEHPFNLQWSRGCEAAEASRSSSPLPGCRPFNGAAAAKPRKLERLGGHFERLHPSMEPRLRSRGSVQLPLMQRAHFLPSFNGAAAAKPRKLAPLDQQGAKLWPSMEPRLRSRGSIAPSDGGHSGSKAMYLQWSRGCEAAEARGDR